jgi:acetyl esterase/lipase
MLSETIILNKERNVTLTTYIQPVGGEFTYINKRPAVIVIPGGGYQFCSDREAEIVAFEYLRAGYHTFVLRYSIKENAVWPNPLDDYDQAMELIRSRADEWHIYEDKIAVLGFSAGGHLASAAATMSKNRPNAALLGYAVITGDVHGCSPTAPPTWDKVDKDTCPCFIFATRTDEVVPIANSIKFMEALDKAGIAFESHIYGYGPHGFSTCKSAVQAPDSAFCNRVPHWVDDSIEWLKDIFGDFSTSGSMTKPKCRKKIYADDEEFLSADCRISYLMQQPQAQEVLEPIIEGIIKKDPLFGDSKELPSIFANITLRTALSFANLPAEKIEEIDRQLNQIPNITQ